MKPTSINAKFLSIPEVAFLYCDLIDEIASQLIIAVSSPASTIKLIGPSFNTVNVCPSTETTSLDAGRTVTVYPFGSLPPTTVTYVSKSMISPTRISSVGFTISISLIGSTETVGDEVSSVGPVEDELHPASPVKPSVLTTAKLSNNFLFIITIFLLSKISDNIL